MFVRFRSARPSDRLEALRRFYVDALGCELHGEFTDHQGFDGLIVGNAQGGWQVEFVRERGRPAPPVQSDEHLLVFYVSGTDELAARAAALDAAGFDRVAPNNPYWSRCGVAFADPDGYHVVVALPAGGPD